MVKKIKTVEQLKKHIGETLHVFSKDGYTFDAVVIEHGDSDDKWLVLETSDAIADKDSYWWGASNDMFYHNCVDNGQITEELTSLMTIEKRAKKKTVKFLTKAELDAARGHFCLMADGSKGFICTKTASDEKPTRVLHNSKGSYGWDYKAFERSQDDAPEAVKHDFKNAYNIWHDEEAELVKVVEILEKYDGRKYLKKKSNKNNKFLTASEIKAGIGHLCKLADGQEAFIAVSDGGIAIICMHSRSHGRGWSLDASDVADKFKDNIKDYKYGWGIHCTYDAYTIKVVSILDEPKAEAPKAKEETPKTILDMTVKELLEKLNAFIKC